MALTRRNMLAGLLGLGATRCAGQLPPLPEVKPADVFIAPEEGTEVVQKWGNTSITTVYSAPDPKRPGFYYSDQPTRVLGLYKTGEATGNAAGIIQTVANVIRAGQGASQAVPVTIMDSINHTQVPYNLQYANLGEKSVDGKAVYAIQEREDRTDSSLGAWQRTLMFEKVGEGKVGLLLAIQDPKYIYGGALSFVTMETISIKSPAEAKVNSAALHTGPTARALELPSLRNSLDGAPTAVQPTQMRVPGL